MFAALQSTPLHRGCTGVRLARAGRCSSAMNDAASARARRWLSPMTCRARAHRCSPRMTAVTSACGHVAGGRGCTGLRVRAGRTLLVDDDQRGEHAGRWPVLIAALSSAGSSLLVDDDCRREFARARCCGDLEGRSSGVRANHGKGAGPGKRPWREVGPSREHGGSQHFMSDRAGPLAGARRHFGRQAREGLRGGGAARARDGARRVRNSSRLPRR